MRWGVLADIHANLTALDAVLADGDAQGVGAWISLGDVVGYGPDPHGCLDRLAERGIRSVQGNHEARVLGLPTGSFNDMAEAAIEYTLRVLEPAHYDQIREFSRDVEVEQKALFCHGSPYDRDEYLLLRSQFEAVTLEQEQPLVFCGHTHQQYVFDGLDLWTGPGDFPIRKGRKLLVNPGSAGQPRDGDSRAAYVVWDDDEDLLVLRRVRYDLHRQMERSLEVGLPEYLALRLDAGR